MFSGARRVITPPTSHPRRRASRPLTSVIVWQTNAIALPRAATEWRACERA